MVLASVSPSGSLVACARGGSGWDWLARLGISGLGQYQEWVRFRRKHGALAFEPLVFLTVLTIHTSGLVVCHRRPPPCGGECAMSCFSCEMIARLVSLSASRPAMRTCNSAIVFSLACTARRVISLPLVIPWVRSSCVFKSSMSSSSNFGSRCAGFKMARACAASDEGSGSACDRNRRFCGDGLRADILVGESIPIPRDLVEVGGVARTLSVEKSTLGGFVTCARLPGPIISLYLRFPGEDSNVVRAALTGPSTGFSAENSCPAAASAASSSLEDQSSLSSFPESILSVRGFGAVMGRLSGVGG